jgi:hypothetical protein
VADPDATGTPFDGLIGGLRWHEPTSFRRGQRGQRTLYDPMRQEAPDPEALFDLVDHCALYPGWKVSLKDMDRGQGSIGLTLDITTNTVNSYHPERMVNVHHLFIVPAAAYDFRSWRRWLFERFHDVLFHEAMEIFTINGDKPYAPSHGPGNDPYLLREVGTDLDRRTSFRGAVND